MQSFAECGSHGQPENEISIPDGNADSTFSLLDESPNQESHEIAMEEDVLDIELNKAKTLLLESLEDIF